MKRDKQKERTVQLLSTSHNIQYLIIYSILARNRFHTYKMPELILLKRPTSPVSETLHVNPVKYVLQNGTKCFSMSRYNVQWYNKITFGILFVHHPESRYYVQQLPNLKKSCWLDYLKRCDVPVVKFKIKSGHLAIAKWPFWPFFTISVQNGQMAVKAPPP